MLGNVMPEKEFNLLHEPWIKVMLTDGSIQEVSLLDIFAKAPQIKRLAGELPAQDVAILRLLLAVLHAVYAANNAKNFQKAIELWRILWQKKCFHAENIAKYLQKYEDRFWLFHPVTPFYQVADLEEKMRKYKEKKGKKVKDEEKLKTVARLIGELCQSDNLKRLFPNRTGEEQQTLPYSEAARWLLYLNGFDDDSAKMPTPKGCGYLGQLGLVYAEGKNLFETLMLNFVLADNSLQIFADSDPNNKAYWEKPAEAIIERNIAQPNTQKDLLTLQSRLILLKRDNGRVTGYLLTMGDYMEKGQSLLNEQMTLWKHDDKSDDFFPKKHRKERQLWRDFAALISTDAGKERNAGVVEWLRLLQSGGLLNDDMIKLSIAGVCYKLKGAGWQVVDFVDDSLQINRYILENELKEWVNEITTALEYTDKLVKCLGAFAVKLIDAGGNRGDNQKDNEKKSAYEAATTNCYYKLDHEFRSWLAGIDPVKDQISEKMQGWKDKAKKIVLDEGSDILESCNTKTMLGYVREDGSVNNGFIAQAQFIHAINKVV